MEGVYLIHMFLGVFTPLEVTSRLLRYHSISIRVNIYIYTNIQYIKCVNVRIKCEYLFVYTYVRIYLCTHVRNYLCTYLCIYLCTYTCSYLFVGL